MKKPWEIVKEIQNSKGRLNKEAIILREAQAKNDEFFAGLNYCFNSFLTFGVAKIPEHNFVSRAELRRYASQSNVNPPEFDTEGLKWTDFQKEVDKLVNRQATGNAARQLVNDLMVRATEEQWNTWYRPILLRDIRGGFTGDTVNRLLYGEWSDDGTWVAGIAPEYRIRVYKCQLAIDSDDRPNSMHGKKQVDEKADGNRLNVWCDPVTKTVIAYSRNGLVRENFPHINAQFEKILPFLEHSMVFDGEVMSASFRDLMKQVQRKYDVDASDAIFYMFDWVPAKDFAEGYCANPQHIRSESLREFTGKHKDILTACEFLEYETIDLDTLTGQKRLSELRAEAAESGMEGVMVKNVDAPYVCDRSNKWLKIKPVISVDLEIVDTEHGKAGKKHENVLGNLICKGHDRGKDILVSVGSGFSDEQREDFWNNRKKLVGRIVEIEADAISESDQTKTTGFYSLRFPRFKSFRDDK